MKILQAVHAFPPSQGGVEHHAYNLSRELRSLGNDVVVITTFDKGTKGEEEVEGIRVRRFSSLKIPRIVSARLSPMAFFAMLTENADVYASHSYGSLMPLFAAIAAFIKRKPFVFTLHGYPELRGKKRFAYYFYRLLVAPIFLHLASKVIVVSKATADKIGREVGAEKIVYVPNGIEEVFGFEPDYEKKSRITYVGRLNEDKGIDVLLRAYARLKRKYPYLTLQIVGRDGGEREKLEALANSLGIKPIFTEMPYEQMPAVYYESKAVVLPSRYEGFSLIWLEAMACARPMFSTPVGEAPVFFDQAYDTHKELFLFNSENELVEKLIHFMENQEKYKKIIERAKYIVKEEYSWENVARLTLNVYADSLKR